jgi:HK97 family phage portal protein
MSKDLPAKPMSFWSRIIKAFYKVEAKPERPAHGANWAKPQGQANPYPAKISMSAFANHGYVYAAVSRASQDLAALPVKLIRGRGENSEIVEEHPFLDLMDQPSTYIDGFSLREQLIVDLMLTGGCYCLLAGANDQPASLFRLHPEQTRIITDPIVGIKGFEYSDSGNSVEYPIERVVFAQSASWGAGVDALYGLGGIQPLQREISADLSAQKLASDSAKKGRPDILISPADEADIWDYEQRRAILDAYRGMSSEGGAMVLSGQVKIEPLQVTPRDLEFQAVRDYTREAISAVFGVPPSVLGDNSANYAVSRQQAQNYWEVQTKRGKKLAHLFTQIAKRFDPSFRVEIDYSGVEALQAVRDGQIDRITKHILNGMDVSSAYAYEGLADAPVIPEDQRESEAEDLGDEEGQNVRAFDALLRSMMKADVDLGKKSNAKEAMDALSESTQKALKKKAADHNEEYGSDLKKKLTNRNYLAVSYHRGLAAYSSSPESVRPSVGSASQWAMGRVNGLLYALRTGKFRRRPYDTDLLPEEHPLSGAEDDDKEQKHLIFGWKNLELAPKDQDWGFTKREARKLLGDDDDMDRYASAFLFVNRGGADNPSAYRLPIAKLIDGELKIVFRGVIAAGSSVRGEPKFGAGFYNLSGATQRDKEKLYKEIEDLYRKFEEQAPPAPWDKEEKADITNFPKQGDDKKISLRNSKYRAFDVDFAEDLKENWPQIWKRGGNIEGNNQYRRLLPIVKRDDKSAQTDTEEMAIKKREAWAARHLQDFRLAGTVAQIKWFVIGERGESYMKKLINEEKKRLTKARDREWRDWLEKRQAPAERRLQRSMHTYLKEARKRYQRRIKEYVSAEKMAGDYIAKSVLSWSELLAVGDEANRIISQFGRDWLAVWALTGNEELDKVYRRAGRTRPLDLVFGERDIAREAIDFAAFDIARTTAKNVQGIIEQGLLAGASVNQIAIGLDNAAGFGIGRSRMIARTESTKAINLATNQSYQTAANEGIKIRKEWLSSRDDKVRETHQELDGQVVGVQEDFIVPSTGERGAAPAAFENPAESINCRCTIVPVIDD